MKSFNKLLFYFVAVILLWYIHSMMIYAADEVYGKGESKSSNLLAHVFRILIEFISFCTIIFNLKKIHFSALNQVVFLWCILVMISNMFIPDRLIVNTSVTLFWPLLYFYFQIGVINNPSIANHYRFFFIILLFVCTYTFYYIMTSGMKLENKITAVGHIYYVIFLIPWILFLKSNFIKNILFLIILAFTILSAKRTAILEVVVIGAIYVFFQYIKPISGKKRSKAMKIAVPAVLISVILFIINYINNLANGELLSRFSNIQQDQGSGRLEIWESVLDMQFNSSIKHWMFGHGHNTVKVDTTFNLSAHNDFLEVLYDYGIFIFCLFLSVIFILIHRCIVFYKLKSEIFVPYVSSVILFVFSTIFSHLILYPTYIIFLVTFWGLSEVYFNPLKKW